MTITINEVAVSVLTDTLTIDDVIEERSVCSFSVYDDVGVHYTQGQAVTVTDTDVIYAGYIDRSAEYKLPGTTAIVHTVTCKDMHYLSDKRIIAKAYVDTLAGNVVKDLITDKLSGEGVEVGIVEDGPIVLEAVFNYISVTKAIESLAEKSNFIWYIDYDKKLYFMPREKLTAPRIAVKAEMLEGSVRLENGNSQYRNTQYVKGGKDITDSLTESVIGDGVIRAWVVSFPIATEPEISLNGTPIASSDIGIRGVESGMKYYWSKGDNTISQDSSETLLISTDTLAITYQGEFNVVVKTYSPAEITATQTAEVDTSGINEDVSIENNATTLDAAFEIANAKLLKYGVAGQRLKFRTMTAGFWSGQILTVSLAEHDISSDFLIESVTVSSQDNVLFYDVTCSAGPEQLSWVQLFSRMSETAQPFVARENINDDEILITLASFSKLWYPDTANNIFAYLYPESDLYPSASLYPVFNSAQRVLYIELLDGSDTVLIRKRITRQTGTTTLLSISYIAPTEAVDTIAKLRWYGGSTAAASNGTGVLVDEQAYAKVKTALESLQIQKTDIDSDYLNIALLDSDSKNVLDSAGNQITVISSLAGDYTSDYTGAQIDTFITTVLGA